MNAENIKIVFINIISNKFIGAEKGKLKKTYLFKQC